jgi:hypothetical protein
VGGGAARAAAVLALALLFTAMAIMPYNSPICALCAIAITIPITIRNTAPAPVPIPWTRRRSRNIPIPNLLTHTLKQPLRALSPLQLFKTIAFVAQTALEIGGPFGEAYFGEALLALGVGGVAGEGEVSDVGVWVGVGGV